MSQVGSTTTATAIAATGFAAFEANVKAWIAAKWALIEPYAAAFATDIEADAEVAFEDVAEIAGEAVLAQAPAVISGTEKFGNAVTTVVQTVESQGKTIAQSTAQTAVQQAYAQIQAAVAAKAAPATQQAAS